MSCVCRNVLLPIDIDIQDNSFEVKSVYSEYGSAADVVVAIVPRTFVPLEGFVYANKPYIGSAPKPLKLSGGTAVTSASVLIY